MIPDGKDKNFLYFIKKVSLSLVGTLFFLFFSLISQARAELKFTPVAKLDFVGGQIFFEGQNTSFTGNGNWLLAPGIKFSDKVSLIPTINGKYRRMREVQELVGGGFLTRETFENSISLKGIYKWNDTWKTKVKGSFKTQLVVESDDEKLGKGLYDNHKLGFGLEFERTGSLFKSIKFSFDPYGIRFFRYKTLSSGSSLGTEIKSGENTLDFNAYDTSISAVLPLFGQFLFTGSTLYSYRPYIDQFTVTSSGQYTEDKRKDYYNLTSLGVQSRLPTFDNNVIELESVASLDLSYTIQKSNQHNYDAARTKFNQKYYDYDEYSITPQLTAKLMNKLELVLSYGFTNRRYTDRVIQDTDGNYKISLLYQNYHTITYALKYPIMYGLSVSAQGAYRKTTSNMEYEKTYRYNYHSQHYFLGLSWEY